VPLSSIRPGSGSATGCEPSRTCSTRLQLAGRGIGPGWRCLEVSAGIGGIARLWPSQLNVESQCLEIAL
jgi:hypothetical protein